MPRRVVVLGLASVVALCLAAPPTLAQSFLLSRNPAGKPADNDSTRPRVSADGKRIVFVSTSRDILPGDTSGKAHVYLWDGRATPKPVIRRLSVDKWGNPANRASDYPAISPDGRWVAFSSIANDLVPDAPDTGGWSNVYVRDLQTDEIYWASRSFWFREIGGVQVADAPNSHCGQPVLSDDTYSEDGRVVEFPRLAFSCLATNIVEKDTNDAEDIFVVDLDRLLDTITGRARRVSTSIDGAQALYGYSQAPSISADGKLVAFHSYATTLVPGDDNRVPDIFVKNLDNDHVARITGPGFVQPNASSLRPSISADGRFVAFESQASNLVAGITSKDTTRIYRTEYSSNDTKLVSVDASGKPDPAGGFAASINYDGSRVSYDIFAQVYLWQQESEATRVVAWNQSGAAGAVGMGIQSALAPSPALQDVIAWSSNASDLDDGPTGGKLHVYVRAIGRSVQGMSTKTAIASPADKARTVVTGSGDSLGTGEVPWVHAFNELMATFEKTEGRVDAAAATRPTVTIGGVAAAGVELLDANTLRFAAPALPPGSSNYAVVRYPDGEVVTLPFPIKSMALVPKLDDGHGQGHAARLVGVDLRARPQQRRRRERGPEQRPDARPVARATAQPHRHGQPLPRRRCHGQPVPDADRAGQPERAARHGAAAVPEAGWDAADADGAGAGDGPRHGGRRDGRRHEQRGVRHHGGVGPADRRRSDHALERRPGLRRARGNGRGGAGAHVVPGRRGHPRQLQPLLPAAESERGRVAGAGAVPAAERRTAGEDLHAARRTRGRTSGSTWRRSRASDRRWPTRTSPPSSRCSTGSRSSSSGRCTPTCRGRCSGRATRARGSRRRRWSGSSRKGRPGISSICSCSSRTLGATPATIEATYLLPDGSTVVKYYTVAANSRFNIWVDLEDPRLTNTAVSTTIKSTNSVPIIVERAMWWPGPFPAWYEAHNSPGATTTGTRWALAEGEVGGERGVETYILIANPSSTDASVQVTLLFEDGKNAEKTYLVKAKSRFNIAVASEFMQASNKRFGALVESLGATPPEIVVERAMYWSAPGQFWAAGTNALATRLQ